MWRLRTLLGTAVVGLVLAAASLAVAQAPPATLPANSVYGRLGAGQPGPGQAIPFAALFAAASIMTGTNTSTVGDLPKYSNVTGNAVQDSGIPASVLTSGSANQIPVYPGGSGAVAPTTIGGTGGLFDTICSSTIGQAWVRLSSGWGCNPSRVKATGNANYYVNGNSGATATCGPAGASTCVAGNDSYDCLTAATACLTFQRVYGLIIASVDFAYQYSGTIYAAHNTGTTNYDLACVYGALVGTSVITIIGDSNAGASATVIADPASGYGLQAKDNCIIGLSYIEYADPNNNGAGHLLVGSNGGPGHVDGGNLIFGASAGTKISAGVLGSFTATGPITDTGNAAVQVAANNGGMIDWSIQTVTEVGTPAYSTATAFISNGGVIGATSSTYSGSATGPRCLIDGPLNVGGYDPNNVFPGNSNCVQNEYVGAIGIQNGTTFGYGTAYTPLQSGGAGTAKDTWGAPVLQLTGTTFANLPSPVAGMTAYVTDGKASNCGDAACTAWATTVTGGTGSLKLHIWYNGVAWTLVGK